MINKRAISTLFALVSVVISTAAAEKIRIAATTNIVGDLVKDIVGDRAEVSALMGPGVDPHLYKASASDVTILSRAKIIFYNGLHLEGRMADLLVKLGRRGKAVYAVTEDIPENRLLEPAEFEGHYDPHVWFDPSIWTLCIDTVANALSEHDAPNGDYYVKQASSLKNRYNAYFAWAKEQIAHISTSQRILVTSHDAYNYFGRAFGFQVIGVQGISTMSEAGLADIVAIVDFIKEKEIKAIFVESSVSPAAIQRVSKDSGAIIGGELFSDAMGLPGQIEKAHDGSRFDVGTYEGMLKHNIATITEALK